MSQILQKRPVAMKPLAPPAPPAQTPVTSQSRAERWNMNRPGLVSLPGYRLTVPCSIINASVSGVRVALAPSMSRISSPDHLPDEVVVVFSVDKVEIIGTIRWRTQDQFGMKFSSSFRQIASRTR